jgi:hypothetical protein
LLHSITNQKTATRYDIAKYPLVNLKVSPLFLQEAEAEHYADFFDAPHENGGDQNLCGESETEWMEVEMEGGDEKSEEEDSHVKKVR